MYFIFYFAVGTGIGVVTGLVTIMAINFFRNRRDAKVIDRVVSKAQDPELDDCKIIVINRNRPTK